LLQQPQTDGEQSQLFEQYIQIDQNRQKHVQAMQTLDRLPEKTTLQQFQQQIQETDDRLQVYRQTLYQYLQSSAENLSEKLVLYKRFSENPEMFLEQRILVRRNLQEIESLQE